MTLMSRPSCCPSLEKTARVRVKERAPCCALFPLAWDAGPDPCLKLCLKEDCCPEVTLPGPAVAYCCLPGGPTSVWSCSRSSCDPPSRSSSSCHAASNRQSEHSTPVRLVILQLFFPPWHCPLVRQHLLNETERGRAYRPAQQSSRPPPLLARPSTRDPGAPSRPSSCRGQSRP